MKCPSCRTTVTAPVERCPSCKFALRKGDAKFGRPPRHSRYLTDRTGRLLLSEMPKLRGQLEIFEKKFPQSLFSVFITELSPGTPVAEYAFWLANRARFSSIEAVGSENFDLLLVIDALGGHSGVHGWLRPGEISPGERSRGHFGGRGAGISRRGSRRWDSDLH